MLGVHFSHYSKRKSEYLFSEKKKPSQSFSLVSTSARSQALSCISIIITLSARNHIWEFDLPPFPIAFRECSYCSFFIVFGIHRATKIRNFQMPFRYANCLFVVIVIIATHFILVSFSTIRSIRFDRSLNSLFLHSRHAEISPSIVELNEYRRVASLHFFHNVAHLNVLIIVEHSGSEITSNANRLAVREWMLGKYLRCCEWDESLVHRNTALHLLIQCTYYKYTTTHFSPFFAILTSRSEGWRTSSTAIATSNLHWM